jgi:hypothetical protein
MSRPTASPPTQAQHVTAVADGEQRVADGVVIPGLLRLAPSPAGGGKSGANAGGFGLPAARSGWKWWRCQRCWAWRQPLRPAAPRSDPQRRRTHEAEKEARCDETEERARVRRGCKGKLGGTTPCPRAPHALNAAPGCDSPQKSWRGTERAAFHHGGTTWTEKQMAIARDTLSRVTHLTCPNKL